MCGEDKTHLLPVVRFAARSLYAAKGPQVLGPRSAEAELREELDMYYSSSFLLNE